MQRKKIQKSDVGIQNSKPIVNLELNRNHETCLVNRGGGSGEVCCKVLF